MSTDVRTWRTADLNRYCGGPASGRSALGAASKMPGRTYGLPAAECITGTKLRELPESTCAVCYAYERGHYKDPMVVACQYRRLESVGRPLWAEAMAELIRRAGESYFRWHDSGDLQSFAHIAALCRVARLCPDVKFWVPTREYRLIGEYRRAGKRIPANLNFRMSAHMLGGKTPRFAKPLTISTVHKDPATYPGAHICPAPMQDNNCGDCRACWSRDVAHVSYHAH